MSRSSKHITVIDLNNFATYPTMSIGYIIAILRRSGYKVSLLTPLNIGIKSRVREGNENKYKLILKYIELSENPFIKWLFEMSAFFPFFKEVFLNKSRHFSYIRDCFSLDSDLVLVSTYTQNYSVVKKLGKLFSNMDKPMIVGGPGFNDETVIDKWLSIQGLNVLAGVEIDSVLVEVVDKFLNNDSLSHFKGIYTKNSIPTKSVPIFKEMDMLPIPDYTDFPWDNYPERIIPYMTGRGCGWGRCNFCTDVTYVNGRTFRSALIEKVISDLKHLMITHKSRLLFFTDLKLNSNTEVWYGLIDRMKECGENIKWSCAVHVQGKEAKELRKDILLKAKRSGLTRITFGLESGSQRLLDHMKKGINIERVGEFVNDVRESDISLRATIFIGYPYETETDLIETVSFLKANFDCFERVSLHKFQTLNMAPIYQMVKKDFNGHKVLPLINKRGNNYKSAKRQLISIVHEINSKGLSKEAMELEGIM